MSKAWRDRETGEFVDEVTYNRSVSHGGKRYEEIDVPDGEQGQPDRIFGSLDDFSDDYDYLDYEELYFDGGMDYGEAE